MPVLQRTRLRSSVKTGDTAESAAFARLYAEYFDPIYGYCRSRLGDAASAEDAASSVFARALAAGPRYDDPRLRSWLFGIAHNVLANRFRAERPQASLASAGDVPDASPLPDDAAIAGDERERLYGALRQLPDDQRRVVELRMVGLSGIEIAGVLGRSHGAVKMLQLRAFARLRELLADHSPDTETHRHG